MIKINQKTSMEKFCCPKCQSKLPMKYLWLLSNKTTIKCKVCNKIIKPKKMNDLYFVFGFISSAIPGFYFARFYHSLPKGLFIGFICGFIIYLALTFSVYSTVKFEEA